MVVPGGRWASQNGNVLGTAAAAAALGVFLLIAYDRVPFWGFHVVALLDTALFTAAAYGWGSMSSYGRFRTSG